MTTLYIIAFATAILWDSAEAWRRSRTRMKLQQRINTFNGDRR